MTVPRLITACMLLCALLQLTACGPKNPIRLGFISGQTGRFANLGTAGLNGAILAVEERNAAGGVAGRLIRLEIRDDAHNTEQARLMFEDLLNQNVVAVIGPMTSAMATALIPIANRHATLLMGGTIVSNQFTGQDDQFVRVVDSSRSYAVTTAQTHQKLMPGIRRICIVFDVTNREYSEDWTQTYAKAWEGKPVSIDYLPFNSGDKPDFHEIARKSLLKAPDLVVLVTSAGFTAELASVLRGQNKNQALATAAWASTRELLQQGGDALEGMLVEQHFLPGDMSPAYTQFVRKFRQRFQQEPDFGAIISYDATNVVLDTLAVHPQRAGLKEAMIAIGTFQGLQGSLRIDRFGDTKRKPSTTRIHNRQYQPIP